MCHFDIKNKCYAGILKSNVTYGTQDYSSAQLWINLRWTVYLCKLRYKKDAYKLKVVHRTTVAMLKDLTIQYTGGGHQDLGFV